MWEEVAIAQVGVSGALAGELTVEVEVLSVRRVADPEPMEEDCQLASDSYDCASLGVLAAPASNRLPESS